jgi:hypothetical protein
LYGLFYFTIKIAIFLDATPCHLRDTRLKNVKSQQTVMLILTAARTSTVTTFYYSLSTFEPIMLAAFW